MQKFFSVFGRSYLRSRSALNYRGQNRSFSLSPVTLAESNKLDGLNSIFTKDKIAKLKNHPFVISVMQHPEILAELKRTMELMNAKGVNQTNLMASPIAAIKLMANSEIRAQLSKIQALLDKKNITFDPQIFRELM